MSGVEKWLRRQLGKLLPEKDGRGSPRRVGSGRALKRTKDIRAKTLGRTQSPTKRGSSPSPSQPTTVAGDTAGMRTGRSKPSRSLQHMRKMHTQTMYIREHGSSPSPARRDSPPRQSRGHRQAATELHRPSRSAGGGDSSTSPQRRTARRGRLSGSILQLHPGMFEELLGKDCGSATGFLTAPSRPVQASVGGIRPSLIGDATPAAQMGSYVARWVIDRYRRRAKLPDRFEVERFWETAVMIADVSGFTRMNESFADAGEAGAERVTKHLNEYFSRLLAIINEHGGDCVKFAGDALIVIFRHREKMSESARVTDDNVTMTSAEVTLLRAVQAAYALSKQPPYVVGKVTLALHTAVAFSDVYAMHLGGNDGQWEFLVAGDAFRQLRHAMNASKRGDAVVSKEAWQRIKRHCRGYPVDVPEEPHEPHEPTTTATKPDAEQGPAPRGPVTGAGGEMKILDIVHPVSLCPNRALELPPAIHSLIAAYVPIPVKEKLKDGIGKKWLAELRTATAIFVNLSGLPLDKEGCDSARVVSRASAALRHMQRVVQHNQGYLRQFCVDDKGTVLIVVFGVPPFSWEDNPYRAVKTAIEIRDALREASIEHAIGIGTGDVYVGSVGSAVRHEHAVVGDTVNTAARLSNKAPPFEIWMDERTQTAVTHRVDVKFVRRLSVKGKTKQVSVYRPVGFNRLAALVTQTQLLGRTSEVRRFMVALLALKAGSNVTGPRSGTATPGTATPGTGTKTTMSQRFWVTGAAGMGKSSLVSKYYQMCNVHLHTLYASGDATVASDPYFVVRTLMLDLLDFDRVVSGNPTVEQDRREGAVLDCLAGSLAGKRLRGALSLLNGILGVSFPDEKLKREKLRRFFGDVPSSNSNLRGGTRRRGQSAGDASVGDTNGGGKTIQHARGKTGERDFRGNARGHNPRSTPPAVSQDWVADKLLGFLALFIDVRHSRGLALILEDVQWYDLASWRVLRRLADRVSAPHIIVFTSRTVDVDNTVTHTNPSKQVQNAVSGRPNLRRIISGPQSSAQSHSDVSSSTHTSAPGQQSIGVAERGVGLDNGRLKRDLTDFIASGGVHLHLEGLREAKHVEALVCQRMGCVRIERKVIEFIHSYSKGRPFLCVELARALVERGSLVFDPFDASVDADAKETRRRLPGRKGLCRLAPGVDLSKMRLPTSVRSLITMRLDHLPATELLICKLASVFGVHFDKAALAHIFQIEGGGAMRLGAALMRLEQRGIIIENRDSWYRFASPLLQEACLHTMSLELRASIHLNIAAYYDEDAEAAVMPGRDDIITSDSRSSESGGLDRGMAQTKRPSTGGPRTERKGTRSADAPVQSLTDVGWHCLRAVLYSDSCPIEAAEHALLYQASQWESTSLNSTETHQQTISDASSIVARYPAALSHARFRKTTTDAQRAFFTKVQLTLKDAYRDGGEDSDDGEDDAELVSGSAVGEANVVGTRNKDTAPGIASQRAAVRPGGGRHRAHAESASLKQAIARYNSGAVESGDDAVGTTSGKPSTTMSISQFSRSHQSSSDETSTALLARSASRVKAPRSTPTSSAKERTADHVLDWEKGEVTWGHGKIEVSHRYHRVRVDREWRPASQIHIPPRPYYLPTF